MWRSSCNKFSSENAKTTAWGRCCVILAGLLFLSAATAAGREGGTGSEPPFSTTACYARHFPLALKVADSMIPAEVRFFCAAPWDFAVFQRVKDEMQKRKFDIAEAFARASAPSRQALVRHAARIGQQAAESGPPGLPATWYVHKTLPALYALKFKTPDAPIVAKQFSAQDVAIMRAVADAIDWKQSALATVPGSAQPAVTLADVPRMILRGDAQPVSGGKR